MHLTSREQHTILTHTLSGLLWRIPNNDLRGRTPITPLICGTYVLCAHYNVGFVNLIGYNTI